MKARWARMSGKAKTLTVLLAIVAVGVIIGRAHPSKTSDTTVAADTVADNTATTAAAPQGDPTVDRHTRDYISQVQTCEVAAGLVLLDIQKGQTDPVKVADEATQARDICNTVRRNLAVASTDHFDDQAAVAWGGVDRMKSGLNALLAYLDNPVPSKLIELRDKIREGDQAMSAGIAQINQRRRVYHLKPVKA